MSVLRASARMLVREPRSLWLVARITAWIAFLSLFARLLPLRTLLRLVDTRQRWRDGARREPQELAALTDRVLRALRISDRACWKRAMVLRRYLLMDGVDAQIVFGVRKGERGGALDGHAWLETGGRPFLERIPPDFVVTFRHPA